MPHLFIETKCAQQCRKHQEVASDWNHLPQHLVELVLGKLASSIGSSNMAAVRLVSRSWHRAFREYPWQEYTNVSSSIQMEKICRVRPCMVSLYVESKRLGTIKLDCLSSLCHLTSLRLHGRAFHRFDKDEYIETCVELGYLPSALKRLEMDSVYVDPGTLSSLHCPSLTHLEFAWEQNEDPEIAELLHCLPSLKVHIQPYFVFRMCTCLRLWAFCTL